MRIIKNKNAILGTLSLAIVIMLSFFVAFATKNPKKQVYSGVTRDGHPYHLCLLRDGSFDFWDLTSSRLSIHKERDRYQWNDGMLVLTFADSDKVWYLRQEGDSLVFDGSLSVLEEGDPRLDKVVFEKRQD